LNNRYNDNTLASYYTS